MIDKMIKDGFDILRVDVDNNNSNWVDVLCVCVLLDVVKCC